jgi:hypothetical protein
VRGDFCAGKPGGFVVAFGMIGVPVGIDDVSDHQML